MVTIDNVIENVGEFKGNIETERRNYERAKQGSPMLEVEKKKLEDHLKSWTGFDEWNFPIGVVPQDITRGDVTFLVKSHSTTKRPKYKTAASELENYLYALNAFALRNEARPGLIVEAKRAYILVDILLGRAEEIVQGIIKSIPEHEISYEARREFATEKAPENFTVDKERKYRLKAEDFADYVRMDRIHGILEKFKKAYEKTLRKEKTGEKVAAITTRTGYKQESVEAEGADWAYVVQTLISTPTMDDQDEGELERLADPGVSLADKQEDMPDYLLQRKTINGVTGLYVGVLSVYDRIQMLKGEETIKSRREKLILTEVV